MSDLRVLGFCIVQHLPAGGDDGGVVPRDPFLPDYLAQPQCGVNICRIDGIGFDGYSGADPCGEDPFADEGDDDDLCDANSLDSTAATQDRLLNITSTTTTSLVNNTAPSWANETTPWTNLTSHELITTESSHSLDARAGGNGNRGFDITWRYLGILYSLRIYARRYPGSTHLHDSTRGPAARNYAVRCVSSSNVASSWLSPILTFELSGCEEQPDAVRPISRCLIARHSLAGNYSTITTRSITQT